MRLDLSSATPPHLLHMVFSFSIFSLLNPNTSWFQVYVLIESMKAHFSPSIYGAFIEFITHLDSLLVKDESEILNCVYPSNIVSDVPTYSTFGLSIISRLGSIDLEVNLENGGDNSSLLTVSLQEIYVRYVQNFPFSASVNDGKYAFWTITLHILLTFYGNNYINLQLVCCVYYVLLNCSSRCH